MILKYNSDEARNLQTYGELPANAKINQSEAFAEEGEEEGEVIFGDESEGEFEFDDV